MAIQIVQCYLVRKIQDCWIAKQRRITVEVDEMTDMIALREIIIAEAHSENLITTDDGVELWTPNDDILTGSESAERITLSLQSSTLDKVAAPVDDTQTVSTIMRKIHSEHQHNYVHILGEVSSDPLPQLVPAPPPRISMLEYLTQKYEILVTNAGETNSPSMNTKSVNYNQYQSGPFPILDGRFSASPTAPATQAPPIELFHHVFSEFSAQISDLTIEIPPDVVADTASLMRSASAIRTLETAAVLSTRMALGKVLNRGLVQNTNPDKTSPDYVVLGQSTRLKKPESTILLIVEEKSEMGSGGDPSVQGTFSYTKSWLGDEHLEVRRESCCPSFIVALAGSWLAILGAVTTSQFIVQRLTDYLWLGNSRASDIPHVISIARVLYALRRSIDTLDSFYCDLTASPPEPGCAHPRFFPSITSFPKTNINFKYVEPLERDDACMTFLATLGDRKIVVKFVQSYGELVHRLLTQNGMAPKLLYYEQLDDSDNSYHGLKIVGMDYVEGETLAQRFLSKSRAIPDVVINAIHAGVKIIHESGYVFGDLRAPNIMITNPGGVGGGDGSGSVDLGQQVKFIDFDWAGEAGVVRYPLHLSGAISKITGAPEYQLIEPDHDILMLEALQRGSA